MNLLIVSSAPFIFKNSTTYAYGPYVDELLIWERYSDNISFCCPKWNLENDLLVNPIPFRITKYFEVADFNLNSYFNILKAFFLSFYTIFIIYKAMQSADHIHLRCPGNIGLLGCIVQIAFPSKPKTAKYAGNWDPESKQPWTYKFQKWILSNTFLTRNMQVLVYGEWEKSTKNIKSFFTATYAEADKSPVAYRDLTKQINLMFVGTLVPGKNPLYSIQLVQKLIEIGYKVTLTLYGDGPERKLLDQYCFLNDLENHIFFRGNQNKELVQKAYQENHFVVLPSDSEGWPKAVAEGMFWGCVPIATRVSCVPFMLDHGNNGVLLQMNLQSDIAQIETVLNNQNLFNSMQKNGVTWSRVYTTDVFEAEIKKLLS